MIEVDGLVAGYGRAPVLDGLDLVVPEGSFFGLLGPNGAGKSTLIACLSGLHAPSGGRIRVAGLDPVRQPREVRAQLGVIPQQIALYGRLTPVDNLRVFGGLHGLSGKRLSDRVEWGLELAQLGSHRDARVDDLSGGMKRRLNLAAGLLHGPRVAICDEPTAGVDVQSRTHLFASLRSLHAEGMTVVYTTHYLEEVDALCDRVAVMDRGRVVRAGPLAELLAHDVAVRVDLERPTDRARVLAALAAAGIDVRAARGRTLEDLLLELTGAEPRA